MKVIYLSYDGMTDPLGQSQVIPYLIGLSKKGYRITIVSCEKKEKYKLQNSDIKALLNSNNIIWAPIAYLRHPYFFSKQINLFRIKKKVNYLYKKTKPEVIHCRSYMAALIGLKLKYKTGIKFIFDMRGFWADERIDGEIWNLQKRIQKWAYLFFKKKEIEFIQKADYTICLTQNAKNEILSWPALNKHKIPIEVIPCCADLTLFSTDNIQSFKKEELKKQLNIKSTDFIVSYLGSVGTWYMLDEMLDFYKCLLNVRANAKFLFITQDERKTIVLKAISKGIPEESLVIVSAARREVPLLLSLSNISLYFIKPLYSKKASSPTKTAEIMGMGIPIITNSDIGDSDVMISDAEAGIIVKNFTTEEYYHVISQIDVLLKTDRNKIRNAAEKYFSLEKGVELYHTVYKKLHLNKPLYESR